MFARHFAPSSEQRSQILRKWARRWRWNGRTRYDLLLAFLDVCGPDMLVQFDLFLAETARDDGRPPQREEE